MTNDQVSWLRPVLEKQGVDVEAKKDGVGFDPNANFIEKGILHVNTTGKLFLFMFMVENKHVVNV